MIADAHVAALRAGATLVTGSLRLARYLRAGFDTDRRAAGELAWESPDIISWSAWLARLWEQLALTPGDRPLPLLLSPLQEQVLWQEVVEQSRFGHALLQVPAAARQARDAYQLLEQWQLRLPEPAPNEDVAAFAAWSADYAARCRRGGWLEGARLPRRLAEAVTAAALTAPARLLLIGFDEYTPQQQQLLDALTAAGSAIDVIKPVTGAPAARRLRAADARQEIELAARWARSRLAANSGARVAVVVPNLEALRAPITRAFDAALQPRRLLPDGAGPARPWNLSLGLPLAEHPVAQAALRVLDLARGELPLAELGALLRAPFLGGAEQEFTRRAWLDARLRRDGELVVTVNALRAAAGERQPDGGYRPHSAPRLAAMLEDWWAAVRALPRRQAPSAWVETLSRLLALLGWPGERALSSEEFQAVQALRDDLAALASLDRIQAQVDYGAAVSLLRRALADHVFQPEAPELPVQVMGVLEAAGQQFDHLWVMGLHDGVWPQSPRPNPFLPLDLQRRFGLPHASAERELDFARRTTARLCASAPEVMLSWPARSGDQDLRPSPLLAGLADVEAPALQLDATPDYRVVLHAAAELETLTDPDGPALPAGSAVAGGTGVFREQAACPFRAFALLRLHASLPEEPGPGLDAATRGSLLHRALEFLWRDLGSQAALLALEAAAVHERVADAVRQAIAEQAPRRRRTFTARFTAIEQARLEHLLTEWLELERRRAPFTVHTEKRETLSFGGLSIDTQIDRLDELADGGHVIIDYKTGKPNIGHWFGERPREPQLPLYSLVPRLRPVAVAFGQLRVGDMKITGVARDAGVLPGVEAHDPSKLALAQGDWNTLFRNWRATLDTLGGDFRQGRAVVDPRDAEACRYCHLTALCRIHEHDGLGLDAVEDGPPLHGPEPAA